MAIFLYVLYKWKVKKSEKIHTNYQNCIFELLLVGIAICIYILVIHRLYSNSMQTSKILFKYQIKSENRSKGNMIRNLELTRLNIDRFHDDV